MLTGNSQVAKEFIGVGSFHPLDDVGIGKLGSDDRSDIEGLVVVQETFGLEGLPDERSVVLSFLAVGAIG